MVGSTSSDNVWRADTPRCAHFSTVISPSWSTEQISVGKCAHQGASALREHHTSMLKIVTWTKQAWKKQTCTPMAALKKSKTLNLKLHTDKQPYQIQPLSCYYRNVYLFFHSVYIPSKLWQRTKAGVLLK